ncbi:MULTISPECIES: hypothetical protein [unclassified Paenibacillus]|uniref:hypothetical protein n=1 Tax=unclassified Paenibacillus TaxID=185978 RepID=UPI0009542769|nr:MULTISPECIES: hypothetical protein [unclassified Paenibacillus]ASS65097.1 hypothetical protein CIC07_02420 [Paenibacillus sp. RUD330]SIQ48598.1 hypothetical protein SAMN05880555_1884 [Paenibacillus sp. RU4X]SIQ70490.1 hypothetical protein SAMN05880570_1882 [Paenibacillus sp. RU4T]
MSRIEKFGRRRPEVQKTASAEAGIELEGDGCPPRREKHPSLQPKLTKWLVNSLMLLFIVLACTLFFWGRSLFASHDGANDAAEAWRGACLCAST